MVYDKSDTIGLICARGGSKGVLKKNLKPLLGEPLITRAVKQLLRVLGAGKVLVSTDCPDIAKTAAEAGANVPFLRPAELAQDNSPEWKVWQHALTFLREEQGYYPASLLVCPTTAPLRSDADIHECLDVYAEGKSDIVVTVTEAHRNPYFNMVKERDDGSVCLINASAAGVFRRQDAPVVYDMTTVAYVARPEFVMTSTSMFEGRVGKVLIPKDRALDIDTYLDFELAEFYLSR